MKKCEGSDGALLCAGTFPSRGDSTWQNFLISIIIALQVDSDSLATTSIMGDVLEILPYDDPVVVIEVDGETLWDAFESSLKVWPAQEW